MVSGEDHILGGLFLPGQFVFGFLAFDKDELADQVEHRVLGENVLPHVGNAVVIFIGRVASARVHALTVAHVEGQEEGGIPRQLGCHIDLFQVHGKVDQAALNQNRRVFGLRSTRY